jgi:hypothetical protein
MKTIKLLVDLEYDDAVMHGDDPEAVALFNDEILSDHLWLWSSDIGDEIGSIKVLEIL